MVLYLESYDFSSPILGRPLVVLCFMKQRYLEPGMWGKNISKLQHPYFCLGVVENTILHRGEQEKYSRKTILHRGEQEKYSRNTLILITMVLELQFFLFTSPSLTG